MIRLDSEAARLSSTGLLSEAEEIYRQIANTIQQHEGSEATHKALYNLSGTLVNQKKFEEQSL
jgi:hypothetical protein